MTQDYNKKSVRQFQCRDYLWEIFEQMGSELECSVDYLVNEAMRQYARSRSQSRSPASTGAISGSARAGGGPTANMPAAVAPSAPAPAPPPPRPPAAPPPPKAPVQPSIPPPLPGAGGSAPPAVTSNVPSLHVIFNGQKIPVQKEEFVIGRGSKTADLPIKDGNISRRHAAVVLQDGVFFMKDLGSTNGIEFNGERVSAKRIEEGDIFQLCDYELKFTYQ